MIELVEISKPVLGLTVGAFAAGISTSSMTGGWSVIELVEVTKRVLGPGDR